MISSFVRKHKETTNQKKQKSFIPIPKASNYDPKTQPEILSSPPSFPRPPLPLSSSLKKSTSFSLTRSKSFLKNSSSTVYGSSDSLNVHESHTISDIVLNSNSDEHSVVDTDYNTISADRARKLTEEHALGSSLAQQSDANVLKRATNFISEAINSPKKKSFFHNNRQSKNSLMVLETKNVSELMSNINHADESKIEESASLIYKIYLMRWAMNLWGEQASNNQMRKRVRADVVYKYKTGCKVLDAWKLVVDDLEPKKEICLVLEKQVQTKLEAKYILFWNHLLAIRQKTKKLNVILRLIQKKKSRNSYYIWKHNLSRRLWAKRQMKNAKIIHDQFHLKRTLLVWKIKLLENKIQNKNFEKAIEHHNVKTMKLCLTAIYSVIQESKLKCFDGETIIIRKERQLIKHTWCKWLERLDTIYDAYKKLEYMEIIIKKKFVATWKLNCQLVVTEKTKTSLAIRLRHQSLLKYYMKRLVYLSKNMSRTKGISEKRRILYYFVIWKDVLYESKLKKAHDKLRPFLRRKRLEILNGVFILIKEKFHRIQMNVVKKYRAIQFHNRTLLQKALDGLANQVEESVKAEEFEFQSFKMNKLRILNNNMKCLVFTYRMNVNMRLNEAKAKQIYKNNLIKNFISKFVERKTIQRQAQASSREASSMYGWNLKHQMFRIWKRQYYIQAMLTIKFRHIQDLFGQSCMNSFFFLWYKKTKLGKRYRDWKLQNSSKISKLDYFIVLWMSRLEANKNQAKFARNLYMNQLKLRFYRKLETKFNLKNHLVFQLQVIQAIHSKRLQSRVLAIWRKGNLQRQKKAEQLSQRYQMIQSYIEEATCINVFTKWGSMYRKKLYLKQLETESEEFSIMSIFYKSFKFWQIKYRDRNDMKTELEKIIQSKNKLLMHAAFRWWYLQNPDWKASWENRYLIPVFYWRDVVLKRCLGKWKIVTEREKWLNKSKKECKSLALRTSCEEGLHQLLQTYMDHLKISTKDDRYRFLMRKYATKWKLSMGGRWNQQLKTKIYRKIKVIPEFLTKSPTKCSPNKNHDCSYSISSESIHRDDEPIVPSFLQTEMNFAMMSRLQSKGNAHFVGSNENKQPQNNVTQSQIDDDNHDLSEKEDIPSAQQELYVTYNQIIEVPSNLVDLLSKTKDCLLAMQALETRNGQDVEILLSRKRMELKAYVEAVSLLVE